RGHTREHAKVAHQQATRRPKRRPAHPPTPSNMLEHAHSPRHRHPPRPQGDHEQATHRPPHTKPQHCGEAHSGEAGRVTPRQGARTGHATTHTSASSYTHVIEHSCGTHHRHRQRPAQRPSPRPADAPTSSNTRKASPTDSGNDHEQASTTTQSSASE